MSDIKAIQKEYEAAEAKLADIAVKLKAAEAEKFTTLPQQVGLKTVNALIKALIPYASGVTKNNLKTAFEQDPEDTNTRSRGSKRRSRARLDEATIAKIITALKEGKKTAKVISEDFEVSVGSVNLIKAKAGLTKKKK